MTRLWLVALLVGSSALVAHAAPADLLLVAPDDATLKPVLQKMSHAQPETHAAWTHWRGQLGAKAVVLARTEGDPLNAVATTTLAIRLHAPRLVVVFGSVRAHDPELKPGDVVVSERFVAFDGMVSNIVPLGGGTAALQWHKLPHLIMTVGEVETAMDFFPADAAALAVGRTLKPLRGRIVGGVLGSAPQVNREADRVAWLRQNWQTSTEDGQSAHVAGVAVLLKVPVVGFGVVDGTPEEAAALALQFVEAWK
jgi:adenosylhomocysteine nucleosidase